ncbi:hypothetical protein VTN96DRAFT_9466 [Rasamsonia emersonii]
MHLHLKSQTSVSVQTRQISHKLLWRAAGARRGIVCTRIWSCGLRVVVRTLLSNWSSYSNGPKKDQGMDGSEEQLRCLIETLPVVTRGCSKPRTSFQSLLLLEHPKEFPLVAVNSLERTFFRVEIPTMSSTLTYKTYAHWLPNGFSGWV